MYRACKHVVKGSALAGVGVAAIAYSTHPAFGTLIIHMIFAKFVCRFCRIACALPVSLWLCLRLWQLCGGVFVGQSELNFRVA
jgi:hypothetical protein